MEICAYCKKDYPDHRSAFCSTTCAFKDFVISQQINNMDDLIKFVKELFKDEFNE